MDHKATALKFLQLASSGKVDDAYKLVSPNFKHHNPHFAADVNSLKQGMAQSHRDNPGTRHEPLRAIAEADLVAVHGRVRQNPLDAAAPAIAVVHIFRFEGGKIAELWDVAQQSPVGSPNLNGMF